LNNQEKDNAIQSLSTDLVRASVSLAEFLLKVEVLYKNGPLTRDEHQAIGQLHRSVTGIKTAISLKIEELQHVSK
jgi:hypothetical protein